MRSISVFVLLFVIFSLSSNSYSQESIRTNISSDIIEPKWRSGYLKTQYYRNGDPIKRVTDLSEWSANLQKSVKGLYYIHVTPDGDSIYLYNWSAVMDSRGLAPLGYKVPSYQDFEALKANRSISLTTGYNKPRYVIYKDGKSEKSRIVYDSLCVDTFYVGLPYYLSRDGDQISKGEYGFWLSSSYSDAFNDKNSDLALESAALGQYSNGRLGLSFANREYGYSVICMQNMSEVFQSKQYQYDVLLPNEYLKLTDTILDFIVANEKKFKADYTKGLTTRISARLEFNNTGSNVSSAFEFERKHDSNPYKFGLLEGLNDILSNSDVYPYYGSNAVPASKDIQISIYSKVNSGNKFKYNDIDLESIEADSPLQSELRKVERFKSIMKMDVTSVMVTDGHDTINRRYLNSVKAAGPWNALLFPIPGMGFSFVNGKKIPLWLLGLASGAVASYAYLQKEDYYTTYTESGYEDLGAYDNADLYNKAFLLSTGVYVGLAAFDITYSILKGIRNKKRATKLNNWIRKTPEPIYLIN